MPDAPAAAPFEEGRAHRWFAVEANNLAWDLVDAVDRSAVDAERMLHAAHAAAFHWQAVGTPLNRLRAVGLLATAYVRAGRPAEAAVYAAEGLALVKTVGDATAFDRAAAFAAAAAAFAVDQPETAARHRRDALAAAASLDVDDRAVFDRFYP